MKAYEWLGQQKVRQAIANRISACVSVPRSCGDAPSTEDIGATPSVSGGFSDLDHEISYLPGQFFFAKMNSCRGVDSKASGMYQFSYNAAEELYI